MTTAEFYFAAPEPSFWKWQDEGNVVAWPDGQTIAFRQELQAVYRRLQTQSLPPFGAVVLLLAACRDSWRESMVHIGLLDRLLDSETHSDRLELLMKVCERLDRVHGLDASLRTSPEAKGELTAMIFEGQGEAPLPGVFASIINDLDHGLSEATLSPARPSDGVNHVLRDLAWLHRGLDRVDTEALALRLKTGLEQPLVTKPVDLHLPSTGAARKILVDLLEDPELGGVARLAKLLLAALHVPTPMNLPENLPVGGVSDISNRGTLDRLLLSELANDGLTLAVRVAMNEALYLRRESPPRPPPRRRLVLLDAGLRMWGVPRVFATAVGLAFAAAANDTTDLELFRAAGRDLDSIDFSDPAGINDHLAVLDHHLHPGDALAAVAAKAEGAGTASDVVVVTGTDVLNDPAFQRALADVQLQLPDIHLATVSRDGRFELWLKSCRGRKLLGKAEFSLEDILFPPRKPTLSLLGDHDADLPAIFHAQKFPLRMSCPIDLERSWHVEGLGTLSYCRDGRLLHWNDPGRGAVELADGLPQGALHAAVTRSGQDNGLAIVGKLSRHGLRLVTFDGDRGSCCQVPLEITIDQPTYAFMRHGIAFVGNASTLNACHMPTGKLLAESSLAGFRHVRSRFFSRREYESGRPTRSWQVATFNGSEIEFVKFYVETDADGQVVTVFDSDLYEGPLMLTANLTLIHCGTGRRQSIAPGPQHKLTEGVHYASRNGTRIRLTDEWRLGHWIFDIAKDELVVKHPEAEVFSSVTPVTLRHRFNAIGADASGSLVLVGRRDSLWPMNVSTALGLPAKPSTTSLLVRQSFEPLPRDAARPYELSVARFADGSRAFLDSRGLLHLRSSDESLSEITLVLVQGQGAGWLSTGHTWGNSYFHDGPTVNLEPHPVEVVHHFVKRLR